MTASAPLCRLDEIPFDGALAVRVDSATGGFDLILMREGEQVVAYHNECPHQGRRLDYAPGRFIVRDRRITCAVHGATFRSGDGYCVSGPCCGSSLAAIPVHVIDGEVYSR